MDINNSSEIVKIITQGAFKVSEILNEDLRKRRIRENKNLSSNQNKSYHVDSEINSIYPTDESTDSKLNFITISKVETAKRDLSGIDDIDLHDPKIGRKVDIER
ncbi:hypothetical protein [Borrelia hermsii]|uniref:Uncharacterized protein n=3 Tax=Borrelia hermsii TaxID=140 RepID=A0AAN0X5Z7_BORHE|nr:hypothetical protein [Borrelia hermsii]AAX16783.1 hypothetical protein BH0266 [Borrelia hermsii DAH]AMR75562.1 hypothetical protein A0V01_03005 [Borrelia hermsii]ANA43082.1 hypothetical protein AXX13_01315 [Borrelia hermsii HS1]UCP01294.1 hypothetical protein K9R62_01340 [Borrelia hermsii]UPA07604.1 hypothetical protein bhDAH_000266 [Borrelia hermsii DAH]